jgi:hypothetical protein
MEKARNTGEEPHVNYDWNSYFAATLEQNIRDQRCDHMARQRGYENSFEQPAVTSQIRSTLAAALIGLAARIAPPAPVERPERPASAGV